MFALTIISSLTAEAAFFRNVSTLWTTVVGCVLRALLDDRFSIFQMHWRQQLRSAKAWALTCLCALPVVLCSEAYRLGVDAFSYALVRSCLVLMTNLVANRLHSRQEQCAAALLSLGLVCCTVHSLLYPDVVVYPDCLVFAGQLPPSASRVLLGMLCLVLAACGNWLFTQQIFWLDEHEHDKEPARAQAEQFAFAHVASLPLLVAAAAWRSSSRLVDLGQEHRWLWLLACGGLQCTSSCAAEQNNTLQKQQERVALGRPASVLLLWCCFYSSGASILHWSCLVLLWLAHALHARWIWLC